MVKPTMKYIATMAGVSQPTVSKILNGKYVDIKKSTRERVLRVVRQLNYRPDYMASSLRSKRRRSVGIAGNASLGEMSDPYASRVHAGAGAVVGTHGSNLVFFPARLESEDNDVLKAAYNGMVDGLIIVLYSRQYTDFITTTLPGLKRGRVPFVVVHYTDRELDCPCVGYNTAAGAETAVAHLAERGYRRIAVVRDSRDYGTRFADGYLREMQRHGMQPTDIVLPVAYRSDDDYAREYERILCEYPLCDGFITTSYQSASGVAAALRRGGRVPGRDVGIVAGSNPARRDMFGLSLTAVDEQYEARGRAAAEMLFGMIAAGAGADAEPKRQVLLPELMVRESSDRLSG